MKQAFEFFIKNIVPFILGFLILLAFVEQKVYYSVFEISIEEFITLDEFLLAGLSNVSTFLISVFALITFFGVVILFVIPFQMLFILLNNLGVDFISFFRKDDLSRLKKSFEEKSKYKIDYLNSLANSKLNYKVSLVSVFVVLIFYGNILKKSFGARFEKMGYVDVSVIDDVFVLVLVVMILIVASLVAKFWNKLSIVILLSLFLFAGKNIMYSFYDAKNSIRYGVDCVIEIVTEERTFTTGDSLIYVGKSNDFLFLVKRDSIVENIVLPVKSIKSITKKGGCNGKIVENASVND